MRIDPTADGAREQLDKWNAVFDMHSRWTDPEVHVRLWGTVGDDPDTPEMFVISELDDTGEDPQVWLIPVTGITNPFTPELYDLRPLSDVERFQPAEIAESYERAWDVVDPYFAPRNWRPEPTDNDG